jgi:hypothetical protein
MLMIVPPVCISGTALDPQERAAEQQPDRSIESFYGRSGDRATLTTYSGVISRRENSDLVQAA